MRACARGALTALGVPPAPPELARLRGCWAAGDRIW
nr:hypothetical protein [Streptomyces sp. NBC_01255]